MDRFQTRLEGAERHGGEWKKNQALPEAGRRSRGRALSDERSKELARQEERQPDSRSPRPAAKPVHDRGGNGKARVFLPDCRLPGTTRKGRRKAGLKDMVVPRNHAMQGCMSQQLGNAGICAGRCWNLCCGSF